MLEFFWKGKQIVDQFALLLLQCQRLPCLQNVNITIKAVIISMQTCYICRVNISLRKMIPSKFKLIMIIKVFVLEYVILLNLTSFQSYLLLD